MPALESTHAEEVLRDSLGGRCGDRGYGSAARRRRRDRRHRPGLWLRPAAGAAQTPPTPEALHRRQIQNSVTRDETREFFRILFHDKSLVTEKMVDEQLALRLRAAFTITKIQEAGERGSLSEQEVRSVKAPTLVVWGKYDELANPASADRLEKTIPGARKVIIDNCGHMPQLERADEFNRLVRDFLLAARATNQ